MATPRAMKRMMSEARNAFDRMTAHSGLQYNIKAEINNVGLLFKFVRQTKYVTVLSKSTVKSS